MQLVADRFAVNDRGFAIDLASGERVQLVWSSAGGASEQARWAARCAWFATLRHRAVARLVDYGGAADNRRFEAWRASGVWRGSASVADEARARVNRFLQSLSVTGLADDWGALSYAGRAVFVPDEGAGYSREPDETPASDESSLPADVHGLVVEPDRRVTAAVDLVAGRTDSRVVALSLWGREETAVADAASVLSRAARLAGVVPVRTSVLSREVRALVAGRTLLLIAVDDVDAGWRAMIDATLCAPRRHTLLFAGTSAVPRVHAVLLEQQSVDALTTSVLPTPECPDLARRVLDSARRAGGQPAVFERLLWGHAAMESAAVSPAPFAAEPVLAFETGAESASRIGAEPRPRTGGWPVHRELVRLRRQLDLARTQMEGGHLASGERVARQASGALARRGDWEHAAVGAVALAEALARHGRTGDADRMLDEARVWAGEARDTALLRTIAAVTGRVWTDAGRLSDAQAVLEAALAAAASTDEPDRVPLVRALARCLYWQGRYDEAWHQLNAHAPERLPDRDAIQVAVARSRVALGRGQIADSIAHAARARDGARDLNAPELLAASCYAWALAQLAAGDCTLADEAAADALAAARRARRTVLSVCARLLRAEIARRRGMARAARTLVARLSRVPASQLPPIVRARADLLRDACTASDIAEAVRRRAAVTGLHALSLLAPRSQQSQARIAADAIAEVLQCCQAAEEDLAVLTAVSGRLRGRLRANGVAFLADDRGQWIQIAGDGGRLDSAIAARAHRTGQLVLPVRGDDHVEAGVPVRYAGRVVGVLAARWNPAAAWDPDEVSMLLSTGAAAAGPALSGALTRRDEAAKPRGSGLLGVSAAMRDVRAAVERAAQAPYPVLVVGESGSGKELVARLVHRLGPRRDHAFCALNCAALPDDLAESELFGHARGAFTGAHGDRHGVFEEAHGGVLFLDEIGELSLRAQAKVLRAIQEGEVRRVGENASRRVDVRLVAATNRDLRAEVGAGRFRMDLLYRLDVIRVPLPPLRERRDDIVVLAEYLWREAVTRIGSRATLSTAAIAALARHDWPGNVRELQNVLASLAVRSPRRGVVLPSALPAQFGERADEAPRRLDAARRAFDRQCIREALSRAGGHRARAAEELGVTRQGLAKLMSRLSIDDGATDAEQAG